ncbi:MAG TPA: hypothetical protein VHO27_03210, partial [Angustibacter sp.]|nr:hypothetical protein [Angustibacter sp.]
MTTIHTAAGAEQFVASAQRVLDHLATQQPGGWAASRLTAGHHEVLAVSGRAAGVGVGDVIAAGAAMARVRGFVGSGGDELGALWRVGPPPPPAAGCDPPLDLLVDLLTTILEADLAHLAS